MNFSDSYLIAKRNFEIIKNFQINGTTKNGNTIYEINNWNNFYNALIELNEINSLKETVENLLKNIPSFLFTKNSFLVDGIAYSRINENCKKLKIEIEQIVKIGNDVVAEVKDENCLKIKMPNFVNFQDYADAISDLNKIISQSSFFKHDGENILFKNVDIGSSWLIFAITGGPILMTIIPIFIDKCMIIYSHYLNIVKQKEDLERMRKDNDEKQKIYNFLTEQYKSFAKKVFESVQEKTKIKFENNEEFERNLMCVEKLGKLIQKGLQILPSITYNSENKILFEPLKTEYIKIADILEIGDGTNKSNENSLNE